MEHIEALEQPLHDMVFTIDSNYRIVSVENNKKDPDQYALPALEIGKSIGEFLKPAQSDCWNSVFERAKATNTRQVLYHRASIDNEPRFLKVLLQWEGLHEVYRVCVDDISATAEDSDFDDTASGFLIMDNENKIEFADAACLKLFGKEKDAFIGSDIRTHLRSDEALSYIDMHYKADMQKHLRLVSSPGLYKGKENYTIVQVHDISKDRDSLSKCGFLNLLLQLTYQLLQATQESLGSVLKEMLRHIGTFCSADRSSIFLVDADDHMSCAYNWYVDSKVSELTDLQKFSLALYPNWYEALHQGQDVYIFSAKDLPDSWQSERELLTKYGVTSVLMEPIHSDNHLIGFAGLETKEHTLKWSEQMRGVLYLFSNILGAFFARMKTEQRLKVALKSSADLIKQREKIHQALQSFYTKINHDTRNSLSSIHASCTLLGYTALDEKQRRYCDTIESNSQFLLHLIRDILEFSFISEQQITLKIQPISLLQVVRNSILAIGTLAHEKNLEIVLQWDDSIPSVLQGDPVRLSQMLLNLLQNAVKFTAKGTVSLKGELLGLTEGQAKVKLSVHDTGRGIDEQTLHCFLIDDDNTPLPSFGEGLGLGLGIVKQLSRALNGNLEVQSCVGQGTTFSLGLEFLLSPKVDSSFSTLDSLQVLVVGTPSAAVEALLALMQEHGVAIAYASRLTALSNSPLNVVLLDASLLQTEDEMKQLHTLDEQVVCFIFGTVFIQQRHELLLRYRSIDGYVLEHCPPWYNLQEILAKSTSANTQRTRVRKVCCMRVLVIDDSIINQEYMRHQLQALQAEVFTAGSSEQAFSLLHTCSVDLIITDLDLPDLDGIAITERIRTFSETKKRSIPVVLLSAFLSEETRQRAQTVGIQDCLLKPVEREELKELLHKYHNPQG